MYMDFDDIWFIIFVTFAYTIGSTMMAFKLTDMLDNEPSVEKMSRHFILWPIETLFILIISLKMYLKEKYNNK